MILMAKITTDNILKIEKNSRVHDNAACTYNVFHDGGAKLIQFDTYGSQTRAIKDKISQSIQFDEQTAKFIISILKDEFNLD